MRGLASPHPFLVAMCGLSAVAVHQHRRRHPFRAANADPHGPDYLADYRVSTVCSTFDVPVVLVVLCSSWLLQAKIFGILAGMDQKDSYCGMYNTGYAGCDAPRAVFRPGPLDQWIVAVACVRLFLLVFMHFALCSLWFFYGR